MKITGFCRPFWKKVRIKVCDKASVPIWGLKGGWFAFFLMLLRRIWESVGQIHQKSRHKKDQLSKFKINIEKFGALRIQTGDQTGILFILQCIQSLNAFGS